MEISEINALIRDVKINNKTALDLSKMYLTQLPTELFMCTSLTSLNLSENKLSELPCEIGRLTNLTSLDLSENLLYELSPVISQLTNLTSLNLSENKLSELPCEIGQLTNLTSLDLSMNCRLSELPCEIDQLKHLTSLNLYGNCLSELPCEIGQLTNLTSLDLFDNHLRKLPPEIGRLTNLTSLDLFDNCLSELPCEIGQLTNLTTLNLSGNGLSKLPPEIGQLTNLTSLNLSKNGLKKLPPEIGQLTNLTSLVLSGNKLSEWPCEIGKLTNLTSLNLTGNKLSNLPRESVQLISLEKIDIDNNPLQVPPLEIAQKGIISIRNYFEAIKKGTVELNEVKAILIGNGRVGKTTLMKRLVCKPKDTHETATQGVALENYNYKIDYNSMNYHTEYSEKDICVWYWDFGGQDFIHTTSQFFFTSRTLYLYVIDKSNPNEINDINYWLHTINSLCKQSPIILVLNKIDLESGFYLSKSNMDRIQNEYPQIVRFVEVSAKEGYGIDELEGIIKSQLRNMPCIGMEIPISWNNVKSKIENRNGARSLRKNDYFISYDNMKKLCENEGVENDHLRDLLELLNDLGTISYWSDNNITTYSMILIDPQWFMKAIYLIMASEDVRRNNGIINPELINSILRSGADKQNYPSEKDGFIIELMKKYYKCFEFEIESGKKLNLIPELTGNFDTKQYGKFSSLFSSDEMEHTIPFKFLPDAVLPRLIVKMHDDVRREGNDFLIWNTAVVLYNESYDVCAFIRSLNNKLVIQTSGKGRSSYYCVILYNILSIAKSYNDILLPLSINLDDCGNIATIIINISEEINKNEGRNIVTINYNNNSVNISGEGITVNGGIKAGDIQQKTVTNTYVYQYFKGVENEALIKELEELKIKFAEAKKFEEAETAYEAAESMKKNEDLGKVKSIFKKFGSKSLDFILNVGAKITAQIIQNQLGIK